MKESEMKEIASMIKDVVIDKKESGEMTGKIAEFRKEFQKTQYCFDNKIGAYEYIKLR
jgi:glycine hydroxymethyltransferase